MKKGFTLIELLVVVAIIGILATFVMLSIRSAQARARDSQRKSNINQIARALEMYYSDYEKYPVISDSGSPNPVTDGQDYSNFASGTWGSLGAKLSGYAKKMPVDPINAYRAGVFQVYEYINTINWHDESDDLYSDLDGKHYALFARLENQNDVDSAIKKNTRLFKMPYFCSDATPSPEGCVDSGGKVVEKNINSVLTSPDVSNYFFFFASNDLRTDPKGVAEGVKYLHIVREAS